jgi:D-alanyl-lipoteichoic acid acyltransferase DltB (MBOAT superfamily)
MGYVIEIYRGNQKSERNIGIYALYVMFYPELLAGPIEKPQNLLHQFHEDHYFDYRMVTDGLKLIAWGMFQKIVIADRLAMIVNPIYDNPTDYHSINLVIATFFYAFQIFCDFSGYSDMAIGIGQVMGFRLMNNFNRPYFSKSVAEFWRRWHISLLTWFRDYIYISLGGNRVSVPRHYFNVLVVFLVSGLWHGANWTFIIWGALHAFYMIFSLATRKQRERIIEMIRLNKTPIILRTLRVFITFCLVCFTWIFFRANSVSDAIYIISNLFSGYRELLSFSELAKVIASIGIPKQYFAISIFLIGVVVVIHLMQRHGSIREMLAQKPAWVRWSIY